MKYTFSKTSELLGKTKNSKIIQIRERYQIIYTWNILENYVPNFNHSENKGVSPATETRGLDINLTLKKLIQSAKTFGEAHYLKKDLRFSIPFHPTFVTSQTVQELSLNDNLTVFFPRCRTNHCSWIIIPTRERIQTVLKKWWIIGFPNWMIERLKKANKSIKSK